MNTFGILNKEYNDDPFFIRTEFCQPALYLNDDSGINFLFINLDAGEKRAHREI